jgi:hypothetical protein
MPAANQNGGFCPKGFVSLQDALERCGRKWEYGDPAVMNERQREDLRRRAWERLRWELHSGDLPSYYRSNGAVTLLAVTPDKSRFSRGVHSWGTPLNENSYRDGSIVFPGTEGIWSEPAFIGEKDLEAFFEGRLQASPATQIGLKEMNVDHPNAQKSKGGRDPDYELMQQFLTAACHILFNDKRASGTPNDFRKDILARMAELGWREPSPPTAKRFADQLWKDLHREK